MRKLLINQQIHSDDQWHVLRLSIDHREYLNSSMSVEYDAIKKWCRKNCSGDYGYSKVYYHGFSTALPKCVAYFSFKDELDVLSLKLFSHALQHNAVWESSTRFTMFVDDTDK